MSQRLQVMVLDDEAIVGARLKPALAKIGCDVEAFTDPRAAFARLEQKRFDVVVTDIIMGDIDGLQVLRQVLERWPEAKVIMITGYAMMSLAREAMAKGAFDFVAKPFEPGDIRAVVARAAAELGRPLDTPEGAPSA